MAPGCRAVNRTRVRFEPETTRAAPRRRRARPFDAPPFQTLVETRRFPRPASPVRPECSRPMPDVGFATDAAASGWERPPGGRRRTTGRPPKPAPSPPSQMTGGKRSAIVSARRSSERSPSTEVLPWLNRKSWSSFPRLKNYIRDASSFNTSGNVAPKLSDMIRTLCDSAIERARQDGRKTLMDRDFEFPSGS